jgi:hypothetical protein
LLRATRLTYEVRLWTPEDMLEEYWREWAVVLLRLVVRLEKVFVAAVVVVVRGLASSDDVGLTRLRAELARRARLKIVRADMLECEGSVGVYI